MSPATPFQPAEDFMSFLSRFRDAGTLLGLLIIGVMFALLSPTFLTLPNLMNILQQSSVNACIALGMTLVITSGGIDLSVGPVAALSAIMGAAMLVAGVPVPLAVIGALGNGLTLLNVQAFNQLLATGMIIIVAMLIDKATTGKQG
jgi:ribose transport system permease protein